MTRLDTILQRLLYFSRNCLKQIPFGVHLMRDLPFFRRNRLYSQESNNLIFNGSWETEILIVTYSQDSIWDCGSLTGLFSTSTIYKSACSWINLVCNKISTKIVNDSVITRLSDHVFEKIGSQEHCRE